jgi:preprotein translocase subunit YajC
VALNGSALEMLMFFTPVLAQVAGSPMETFGFFVPMVGVLAVMYFLMIRPQQQKQKAHMEMLQKVSRGDTVVTQGGLIGKVTKVVDDNEIQVEVGENVKVRVLKAGLAEVRAKGEPAK